MSLRSTMTAILAMGIFCILSAPLDAATVSSLTDNFTADTVDAAKWNTQAADFEVGSGTYTADTTSNVDQLTIAGTNTNQSFWGGTTLESVNTFSSSVETTITVDRVSLSGAGTAKRSSLWIDQNPSASFLHFAHNHGENGWQWNSNEQGPTGGGNNIGAFDAFDNDLGAKEMKLVYRPLGGSSAAVDMYLDGVLGATANFNNWDNSIDFHVRLSGMARQAPNDTVSAVFDNLSATTAIPEPSTFLLAALGLLGLLGFTRRRRK